MIFEGKNGISDVFQAFYEDDVRSGYGCFVQRGEETGHFLILRCE